jgi:hypothetical protein
LAVAAAGGDSYYFLSALLVGRVVTSAMGVPWVVTGGVVAVDPPVVAFARLLRQLRMSAGLSQEELAAAAGVGVRTVSDPERGWR